MSTSPAVVMTAPDIRRIQRKSALAAVLTCAAVAAWSYVLTPAIAEKPQAIPRALFQLGEHLCRKNDGLASVEAYPERADTYGVRCADGALFPDITASIRP